MTGTIYCRGRKVEYSCGTSKFSESLLVKLSTDGEWIETIETMVRIGGENRQPKIDREDREAAIQLISAIFPDWKAGPAWVTEAIIASEHHGTRRLAVFGDITLLIQSHAPETIAGNFAEIVVTRGPIDQWDYYGQP